MDKSYDFEFDFSYFDTEDAMVDHYCVKWDNNRWGQYVELPYAGIYSYSIPVFYAAAEKVLNHFNCEPGFIAPSVLGKKSPQELRLISKENPHNEVYKTSFATFIEMRDISQRLNLRAEKPISGDWILGTLDRENWQWKEVVKRYSTSELNDYVKENNIHILGGYLPAEELDKNVEQKRRLKVFISYSREDIDKVLPIYNELKNRDFDVWIDIDHLLPGQDWEREIQNQIKKSDVFIACLSKNSVNKKGYFQKELKKGIDVCDLLPEGHIFFIPVRIEQCVVPSRFEKYHYCDIFIDGQRDKLIKSLEKIQEQSNR